MTTTATPAAVAAALSKFVLEFMGMSTIKPDDLLAYSLTSMQQYELLVFIENEYGIAIDLVELDGATLSKLAQSVAARGQT